MSKRILQLVSYLIISLSVGIVVAFITSNLESTAEEKKLRQATRREIRNIVSAFKDSVPGTTSDQIIKFLEKFTADVMKDKVIAVDVLEGKKPDK
ncbi:MAG: hypothetical protein HY099_05055, partial [Nitrospirae bacterium]|nr:hypothetical protein [Nitrospirota bacterium]